MGNEIIFSVETEQKNMLKEMFPDNSNISPGSTVMETGQISLVFSKKQSNVGFGESTNEFEFLLGFAASVSSGVLACWIYEKIKNKSIKRITFRQTIVTEITEEKIKTAIEKEISISD